MPDWPALVVEIRCFEEPPTELDLGVRLRKTRQELAANFVLPAFVFEKSPHDRRVVPGNSSEITLNGSFGSPATTRSSQCLLHPLWCLTREICDGNLFVS